MLRFALRPALGLVVCVSWLAGFEGSSVAADKSAGASAGEQAAREAVRAALMAEAAGDHEERARLLKLALTHDPDNAEANWHSGRTKVAGKWVSAADYEGSPPASKTIEEYRKLREAAGGNTKLLRNLARWCLKAGWEDAARVHFAQVLARGDADAEMLEEAIRRLDLHYVNGRWMNGKEIAAEQKRTQVIEASLEKWRPKLQKLQVAIDGDDARRRDGALQELSKLEDPLIIPALESFLLDGGDRFQEEAVRQLGKLPPCEASEALARFAVLSPYVGARDVAASELRRRHVFEYCPMLLQGLNAPFESQFQISKDRAGRIFYVHAVHRQNANVSQTAVARTVSLPVRKNTGQRMRRDFELELQRQFQAFELRSMSERAADVQMQARIANDNLDSSNRRIMAVLASATGATCGNEPGEWWEWWQDHNQKWWPQYSEFVCSDYQRTYELPVARHSCFVAGTLVHTEAGLAKIETVKPGDRVLAQDQETGELGYRVVQQTTVRPPAKILVVRAGGEEIRTTLGHPFWVSGEGWKLAKDLRAGERLHSLSGVCKIDAVEAADREEQAFNLVVEDFHSYLVGQQGLLVHDNEFRKPTRAIVPGLLAAAAPAGN